MKQNSAFESLRPQYLFQEIVNRTNSYCASNPESKVLRMGIGDTTQPLIAPIVEALKASVHDLSKDDTYSGYGPEHGIQPLRKAIAETFYKSIGEDEVFISDGANSDISRLQVLFGHQAQIAIQDPSYPAYGDCYRLLDKKPIIIPCSKERNFSPDFEKIEECELFFCCSPNNPTGTVFSHEELERLVHLAKKKKFIIAFDAAYAAYIRGPHPKSIYEIPGSHEVAIEIGSFSKMAGMSGVRLGWSVVPHKMKYRNGRSINPDWMRTVCTLFNGASILSQKAGIAACTPESQKLIAQQIDHYLKNTAKLKKALEKAGYQVFGGEHAPYVFLESGFSSSWEAFDHFLTKYQIVTTPGVGFGQSGEGFIRLSGFAHEKDIDEACRRLSSL